MKQATVILFVLFCASKLAASPTSDLSSPSPEIRAAAAQILRRSYLPPPQSKWNALLATLKVGDSLTNVEAILRAHGFKPGIGGGSQTLVMEYRLDESWLLKCYYLNQLEPNKCKLYDRHLEPGPSYVHVSAPTNFTGIWIEYYVNGQKCLETAMRDGVPCGDRICYGSDGSKVYVEHHGPNTSEVGWTEYYHSGGIKEKGKRDRTGRPIGTWTNYSEPDGSVLNTHSWTKP